MLLTHASWVLIVIAALLVAIAVTVYVVRRRKLAKNPRPTRSAQDDARPLAELLAEAAAQGQADRGTKVREER